MIAKFFIGLAVVVVILIMWVLFIRWFMGMNTGEAFRFVNKKGPQVCMATHPDKPISDTHARRRKKHLTEDGKTTICNMRVDPNEYTEDFLAHRKECKLCFKKNQQ